jgi:hypothetical protein
MASSEPSSNPSTPLASYIRRLQSVQDSPHNRELLAAWERQQSRRLTSRQILFTGTSSAAHGRTLSSRLDGTTSTSTPTNTSVSVPQFIDRPIDPGIEFTLSSEDDLTTVDPAALDLHITSRILSGSSISTHITSKQAFRTCMSVLDIRSQFPNVYEAKKNRCATVPSLFQSILENQKHLIAPSNQQGEELRTALKEFIDSVSAEYQTPARTNSELILCALSGMKSADTKCFMAQFHKGISCSEKDFERFEDDCAQGKISEIQINYSQPVESLIGFSHFTSSAFTSVFLIRLTTALTDYMAYVTNSGLQLKYTTSSAAYANIRFKSGMNADQFAIDEEQGFALMTAAAAAAQRSIPDNLDRGLKLLEHFPAHIKTLICKLAQKKSIPENLMTRDWVMGQLKRIELENAPVFSWNATATAACNNFAAGKCTRGSNCPFTHTGVAPVPTNNAALITAPVNAALATAQLSNREGALADDAITITCALQSAAGCTKTFKASPSHWAALKQPDGKPFSIPKSCKPCRDFKKQMAGASMVTAQDDIADDDKHENDGADDDFYTQMADYDLAMTNALY